MLYCEGSAGLNLAYVYFESEASCRPAAKLLSRLEASRIAIKIASLPKLIVPKTIVRARPKNRNPDMRQASGSRIACARKNI